MLVLARRVGEEVVIQRSIRIAVLEIKKGRVRLGITAPDDVGVDRAEVHERREPAWGPAAVEEDKELTQARTTPASTPGQPS